MALARKKIIKARRKGLSFDPKKKPKVAFLTGASDWGGEVFQEFQKKVDQAKVVMFTVMPKMDEPDVPNVLIITSLWGEILVSGVHDLLEATGEDREHLPGWREVQGFFKRPETAYITDRENQALTYLAKLRIIMDETAVTGLETWHRMGQGFCPCVEQEFAHIAARLTASFRGTASSGWTWHRSGKEELKELTPDQARLAFAIGNAMASLTLDGVVWRIDPEDTSSLRELGALVLKSEQEDILEGEETLGMRSLQLEPRGGEAPSDPGAATLRVTWSNLQVAYREPFGRLRREGVTLIPEKQEVKVLERHEEIIDDIVTWEESLSCISLLGPQHQRPPIIEGFTLPEPMRGGILKVFDQNGIRRANERLGVDPDDLDFARERFAELRMTDDHGGNGRTPSPPPPLNVDVHGLWDEERNRREGGRFRGPPRLRWEQPIRREALPKRHRELESRSEAWKKAEDAAMRPPEKKTRAEDAGEEEEQDVNSTMADHNRPVWYRGRGMRRGSMRRGSGRGRGVEPGGQQSGWRWMRGSRGGRNRRRT